MSAYSIRGPSILPPQWPRILKGQKSLDPIPESLDATLPWPSEILGKLRTGSRRAVPKHSVTLQIMNNSYISN